MEDDQAMIQHLRHQVANLRSLLSHLENQEKVGHEDYAYLHAKLQEVIGRLKALERLFGKRGGSPGLRAVWLN
jgi:ribosome assembly protein YihI (activator of Der GTPase)